MLTVKILNAHGTTVTRDELVTLYATDMSYEPYHRKATIDADGGMQLEVPEGPVILHAKLVIPGYGFMWVIAVSYTHLDVYKRQTQFSVLFWYPPCRLSAS